MKSLSCVQLFATPWTVAYQAPQSMGFSRQEYWRGLPFPSPGDLPNPGIDPGSPALQTDVLPSREAYWSRVSEVFFLLCLLPPVVSVGLLNLSQMMSFLFTDSLFHLN